MQVGNYCSIERSFQRKIMIVFGIICFAVCGTEKRKSSYCLN